MTMQKKEKKSGIEGGRGSGVGGEGESGWI